MARWFTAIPAFAGGSVVGMLAGAIYAKARYDLPEGSTTMESFLEDHGLNLLGDTLAGFLGLATLLVVLFTYFAQKAQALQNLTEMKQQNAIAEATARANYALALFDKRLTVYDEFNELTMEVSTGQHQDNFQSRALRAVNAAKNVLPVMRKSISGLMT